MGLGALGIMYGDFFAQKIGQENVIFLADEARCQRYAASRITCNGRENRFQYMTSAAYCQAFGKAQLLMYAVKGTALEAAIKLADAVTGSDTVIISVLNGISSEDEIERHLGGRGAVVHCVAQGMDALRQNESVTYSRIGELRIGITEKSEKKTRSLASLETFFDATNFAYKTEEDILRRMWCKWMLNVGVNQTVAVCAGTFADVHKEGAQREKMKAAMREVTQLAQAMKINVTDRDLNEYVSIIDTLSPAGMPSMRQDTKAGRKTEVELFAGTVIRLAEKHGVDVPVNRSLYAEIKAIEARQDA